MPFIDRNGTPIHWEETGSGTPLLLIMGLKWSSQMWYAALPEHAAQHRVITFDNQGTGQSGTRRRTSVTEMAQDALAVLDAAGVDSAHVYGVSMGGGLAMELALLAPERVRSLVLGCTAIKTELSTAPKPWMVAILKAMPGPVNAWMTRRGHKGARPEAITRDLAAMKAETFDWDGVVAQAQAIAGYSVDKTRIAALDLPTLVVHGSADRTVPYAKGQEIAATIPGARLITIEGAGHNYFVLGSAQANAATLAFLTDVDAATHETTR